MKKIILFLAFLQFVLSHNLRNLLLIEESEKYKQLVEGANNTFYQLYNITLDFKGKNFVTFNDETKYYRVVIDEFDQEKYDDNDNGKSFRITKEKLEFLDYIPPISKTFTIEIFGKKYNLYEEIKDILNVFIRTFNEWENCGFEITKRNYNIFESHISYKISYLTNITNENYINGSFVVTIEDKDDIPAIEETLNNFWDKYVADIPKGYEERIKEISEFVVNTLALWHTISNRRENLVETAVKTFKQLYNITIDFEDRNVVTVNDEIKYYKVLLEEYPNSYQGYHFTLIKIENKKISFADIPSDLYIKIFGRSYNLKEEFESIAYLLAASIDNGEIILYKNDINKFESEVRYKCYLSQKNEEQKGAFVVSFEDKDDKLTIEETVETFWNNVEESIQERLKVDVRIISEFVVTTFGIWHHIANRYDKIVKAANNTLYQVYNISINFNGRYVITEDTDKYYIRITIDEFPIIPANVETYFNISSGRVSFPAITFAPEYKLEIFDKERDLEEEYRAIANMFAAGLNNGQVYIYKKNIDEKKSELKYKCFVHSESGDVYGAFEISIQDKDDETTIEDALTKYWDKIKGVGDLILEVLKYISDFVSKSLGFWRQIKNAINPSSSASTFIVKLPKFIWISSFILMI